MAARDFSIYRAWNICSLIFLNPMTRPGISKRISPGCKPDTMKRIMLRFLKIAEKAGIKVTVEEDEYIKKEDKWHIVYSIEDIFWRDKLEKFYAVTNVENPEDESIHLPVIRG